MAAAWEVRPLPGINVSADADCRDGLRECARSAHLDDVIDPTPARPFPDAGAPVLVLTVVDRLVRPQRAGRSSISSDEEVTITAAPITFAIWRAKADTPPVPSVSTNSPAFNRECSGRVFWGAVLWVDHTSACQAGTSVCSLLQWAMSMGKLECSRRWRVGPPKINCRRR
ncbi:MAG TPA: hypothetical protein VE420_03010, partial [Gemmatimonadales bacterium]|nr:hypothetical protein [Gemmatimonadales bacterium]